MRARRAELFPALLPKTRASCLPPESPGAIVRVRTLRWRSRSLNPRRLRVARSWQIAGPRLGDIRAGARDRRTSASFANSSAALAFISAKSAQGGSSTCPSKVAAACAAYRPGSSRGAPCARHGPGGDTTFSHSAPSPNRGESAYLVPVIVGAGYLRVMDRHPEAQARESAASALQLRRAGANPFERPPSSPVRSHHHSRARRRVPVIQEHAASSTSPSSPWRLYPECRPCGPGNTIPIDAHLAS